MKHGTHILVDWNNGIHKFSIRPYNEDVKKFENPIYVVKFDLINPEPFYIHKTRNSKGLLGGIYNPYSGSGLIEIKFCRDKRAFTTYDTEEVIEEWPGVCSLHVEGEYHKVYI